MKTLATTMLLTLLAGMMSMESGKTQERCLEGRNSDGTCVNAALGLAVRQSTIIATQPKISNTAPLNLPNDDSFYIRSFQRFEYTRIFGAPATRFGGAFPVNPLTMP